jgi:hypothetical protein
MASFFQIIRELQLGLKAAKEALVRASAAD